MNGRVLACGVKNAGDRWAKNGMAWRPNHRKISARGSFSVTEAASTRRMMIASG